MIEDAKWFKAIDNKCLSGNFSCEEYVHSAKNGMERAATMQVQGSH